MSGLCDGKELSLLKEAEEVGLKGRVVGVKVREVGTGGGAFHEKFPRLRLGFGFYTGAF